MTSKVGPKGQVVIPKPMRDRLGLGPGDEVVFVLDGDEVRVRRARGMASLAGALGGLGLRAELEAERRHEREREERLSNRGRS
jgi:AbrB family looped-hinge helix DNA binding protein